VPRAEVGQGMTTAIAMMVAEELGLPLGKVTITLADARRRRRQRPPSVGAP
jgi:isoquinoline 1-oxidoreductase beta subunit